MEAWAAIQGPSEPGAHDECARTRLIGELSRLLHDSEIPPATRAAGLTLIGWLARRMPGEAAHTLGAPRCPDAPPPRAAMGSGCFEKLPARRSGKR